jgi:superoxide reductase
MTAASSFIKIPKTYKGLFLYYLNMAELKGVYKCEICGNIVEVLHKGAGELVCCGQPMTLLKENFEGEDAQKHTPVIEDTDKGVLIKIGKVAHPMEPEHYIEWIEILTKNRIYRKHLNPGEKPEAEFCIDSKEINKARMYCNIHGLWKKE